VTGLHPAQPSDSPKDATGSRAPTEPTPTPLSIAVLTVSDTRTLESDTSGGLIVSSVLAAGHRVSRRTLLPDAVDTLRHQFQQWIDAPEVQVVIATGGTGITRRDVTPEALEPLISKRIDGFGELFRWLSYAEIGASTIQSRAVGAICGQTLVFLLPGSTNAVRLALERILLPQLDSRTKPCNFVTLLPRL
jgi:molybdopterin adenylyltransferase